jgi:hypothetical protein
MTIRLCATGACRSSCVSAFPGWWLKSTPTASTGIRLPGWCGADDLAFVGRGDTLIAALDQPNMVALVRPDGAHTIVLTGTDGLENPSAIAVRGRTVYVTDAAYSTHTDPNLLTARLTGGAR